MLGKERQRLMKNMFGTFVTDDTKQNYYIFLKEIFSSQREQSCEVTLFRKGNSPIYAYLIGVISKNGVSCDISMIDITERKLALEKLSTANKELEHSLHDNADNDLFITVLEHDLRNPFSSLLGFAELLMKDIRTHDIDYIEKLSIEIYNSTYSAYSMLEDLLKWSRVRTGGFPFEPQKISFKSICDDVVKNFTPIAFKKKILINCFENERINIVADREMIKAILRNLVSNAIKFTNNEESGDEAVNICKNNPDIDLILMDFYMPNMNGLEATRLIRLFNKKVIIIMETANELTDVMEESSREGVNDFFFKPYRKTYLNSLILKHCG